eukprot:1806630-Ditylum_brightwellii.AAC.1
MTAITEPREGGGGEEEEVNITAKVYLCTKFTTALSMMNNDTCIKEVEDDDNDNNKAEGKDQFLALQ